MQRLSPQAASRLTVSIIPPSFTGPQRKRSAYSLSSVAVGSLALTAASSSSLGSRIFFWGCSHYFGSAPFQELTRRSHLPLVALVLIYEAAFVPVGQPSRAYCFSFCKFAIMTLCQSKGFGSGARWSNPPPGASRTRGAGAWADCLD